MTLGRPARLVGCAIARRRPGGFTLLEILVTISIIAILVSLVLPMLSHTLAASRGFKCQQALRSVAYDFQIFSDDTLHGYRGGDRDGQGLSPMQFTIENFVESQYGLEEFWEWPGEQVHALPDAAGNDPMRCPEIRGPIVLHSNTPCTQSAVSPYQNVSFGFNIRLRISDRNGGHLALTQGDIEAAGSDVPLVWDIDGATAVAHGQSPHFSGPSLGSVFFPNDRFWFPGMRHNRAANFAFTDGHVASSTHPLDEPDWNWAYSPRR